MKTRYTLLISLLFMATSIGRAQNATVKEPAMVSVEGGSFQMGYNLGSKDEQPVHQVTLNSFYIGKFEVTYSDFKRFVDATGFITDAEQPDTVRMKHGLPHRGVNNGSWHTDMKGLPIPQLDTLKPVGNISWYDAMAYCDWLSKITGKKFRLPTEAEWEYAAKGGVKSKGYKYVGGNDLGQVAWFVGNSDGKAHTVGQKMANELGIYDMAGNAREWCSDWYGDTYYQTSPEENPAGPEHGIKRVLRGGSWGSDTAVMGINFRNNDFPYTSALDFGFRVAISGEPVVKKAPPKQESDLFKDLDTKGFVDIYGINFDIGKAAVKPESLPIISQLAQYLKDHPTVRIVIEGHTDNTGSESVNLTLSDKRAASIKAELITQGIDAGRMETVGYGATKPIADNKTAAGRTQNRRVTIKKLP
jgi:formylglycine-generating enzyme required for sulfatase activity